LFFFRFSRIRSIVALLAIKRYKCRQRSIEIATNGTKEITIAPTAIQNKTGKVYSSLETFTIIMAFIA
jgi:hypothetical protein